MPSPFPGMDPYLEGEMWQEFHDRLANQISVQLMPLLSPKYVALLAKRYVFDRPALGIFDLTPERVVYPGVHVVALPGAESTAASAGDVAIAAPALELASLLPEEVPILSVEIRCACASHCPACRCRSCPPTPTCRWICRPPWGPALSWWAMSVSWTMPVRLQRPS
jgi:hypothetical protein